MEESRLRDELASLLNGGQAHVDLDKAIAGLQPENRTKIAIEGERSIWEVLEHIRIAQHDILQYVLNPDWRSPAWPSGYWPKLPANLHEKEWVATVKGLKADLEEFVELVRNPKVDLTAGIPHSPEHTFLREVLLAADHNAYHLGQVVAMRKALSDWQA